jgi:hypothetical protein
MKQSTFCVCVLKLPWQLHSGATGIIAMSTEGVTNAALRSERMGRCKCDFPCE